MSMVPNLSGPEKSVGIELLVGNADEEKKVSNTSRVDQGDKLESISTTKKSPVSSRKEKKRARSRSLSPGSRKMFKRRSKGKEKKEEVHSDRRRSRSPDPSFRERAPYRDREIQNMEQKVHRLPMKGEIYLNMIKRGEKLFEGRVYGIACQKMRIGDQLRVYDNRAKWGILCDITSLDVYRSFEAMLRDKGVFSLLPQLKKDCKGLTGEKCIQEGVKVYKAFPGSNRVSQVGCVAIGVAWIKDI